MESLKHYVPYAHMAATLFGLIELGLTCYLVSPWGAHSIFAFLLFCSVWTLLVLVYIGLGPSYFPKSFQRTIALALEWLTMIFWFAGSIALAVLHGSPSCGANTYCGSTEAANAFGFLLWIVFLFIVVVDTMATLKGRARGQRAKPVVGV
ncbi:hypothetical protein B0T20DRAFT_80524 [Sordaria brevicollis]|uniref:MARVEL domain-containing protein n=1 Tax=Sordaria brevicollis TaxID=83679 RepID=A0AAE0P1E9_SORBR|nr:hypothetical protein B0T20DRAFT_80524 [Sordaria brevicollis]